jgi:hypothetical protein
VSPETRRKNSTSTVVNKPLATGCVEHPLVNLKTAKALGIAMPQLLFARADEVME